MRLECVKRLEIARLSRLRWDKGEYVLIIGFPQVGKTPYILGIFYIAKNIHQGATVLILTRNMLDDAVQLKQRISSYNNMLKNEGIDGEPLPGKQCISTPRMLKDLTVADLANSIEVGKEVILGLSNTYNLEKIRELTKTRPDLVDKSILVVDEIDLNPPELEAERTQTENLLREVKTFFRSMFAVTATALPCLLQGAVTQILTVPEPNDYFGIDKFNWVDIETIYKTRNGKICKKYDAERDWYNLDRVMRETTSRPRSGLLINMCKETKEHKNIIETIRARYPKSTYIEFNGNSIKTYYPVDHSASPNKIVEESGYKLNRKGISDILQLLKDDVHDHKHIVIIAGLKAGRGISFVSNDRLWHLTHLYLAVPKSAYIEYIEQVVGRLAGRYSQESNDYMGGSDLTLYCPFSAWEQLSSYRTFMDKVIEYAKMDDKPNVIHWQGAYYRDLISKRMQNGVGWNFPKKTSRQRKPYKTVYYAAGIDKGIVSAPSIDGNKKIIINGEEFLCDRVTGNNEWNLCYFAKEGKKYTGRKKGKVRHQYFDAPNTNWEKQEGYRWHEKWDKKNGVESWDEWVEYLWTQRPDLKAYYDYKTRSFSVDIFMVIEYIDNDEIMLPVKKKIEVS